MFAGLYKKRIVNINFNITLASIIATFLAAYPVASLSTLSDSMAFILLSAFAVDAIFDAAIFALFHRLANSHKNRAHYWQDAGKIQIQRVFLSIIFFIVAISLDYAFMHYLNVPRASSFIISYLLALALTRIIHTVYGLKTGLFK